jgi:hypothetical protein
MRSSGKLKKIHLLLLFPAGFLLARGLSLFPWTVEKVYATGVDRVLVQALGGAAGFFPFSCAEVLVILLAAAVVWRLTLHFLGARRERKAKKVAARRILIDFLALTAVVYFLFVVLWGLNYGRPTLAEIARLDVRPATAPELAEVCRNLIDRANQARVKVGQDENGVMVVAGSRRDVLARADAGYRVAAASFPELSGNYARPKPILLSRLMSYTGLAGVYCPFTGEANVNMDIPQVMLPFAACHEMAHQRGFAREDEANYISYVTCNRNLAPDFQYSGTLFAAVYAMNALQSENPRRYQVLKGRYSPEVSNDLKFYARYWARHRGPAERITDAVNDLYLKSNRQRAGIYSYDRMVALLVGEYRRDHKAGMASPIRSPGAP